MLHEGQIAVIGAGLELHSALRRRLDMELAALREARVKVPVALFEQAQRALDELNDGLQGVLLTGIEAH
ncbi:MAG: hypothetical protein GY734_15150 [Herbaspirillum sp.]|uniref:hypothetical protein n=1 Tax=unclassified Herbaspirillum TaxID=2624150 RepID=UPI000C0925C1|nr:MULTISPECIES: hypothetical protein [unclassified Herbaspirillum]MAF00881.1 hypothetical protein [Herbaspirillum sp.]MBO16623.1 hypothetical protein [Herbaspirillum sp.]MCP3653891.1 hypothetical protein [Herbaspirillum sp.]MCP3947176.1 hypothetical protein [Herbaspirillum sp.]MCP4032548.1 hypothetical protein [Herbaspirillum sp.]|tara:strand:- start:6181 stop:6387 length:207 start_codon:yes stop_codon:yes gene_type:complete